MLGDALYNGSEGDAYALASAVSKECSQRGFSGVVCDFEQRFHRPLEHFILELMPLMLRKGFSVFVPERYAACHEKTMVFLPTAMSSGSLAARLKDAARRYGGTERLVLEIERIHRDIILPSPQNTGRTLHPDELERLLIQRGGASFFSEEMCTRYFTYKDTDGNTHFVLYDDAGSFRKKAQTAMSMGIYSGFVLYPEVEPFLRQLNNG